MHSLIIWDFNGTILDDVGIGIQAVNKLLLKRNIKPLECVDDYYKVFGFPIIEYYKRLGFDFEKEDYNTVANEWVKEYNALESSAPIRPFVKELLEKIRALGIPQIILSASEKNMLSRQIASLGISEYFDEILGADNIYAYGKQETALDWMKQKKIDSALLIGDTEHDAEVAKAIGASCVLVSGGHQNEKTLKKCGVTVATPQNICDIIISLLTT